MAGKYVDNCGGLKPIVIPKTAKKDTAKKTVKKATKKSK